MGDNCVQLAMESFKEIIQTYAPTVDDHGPLAGPIRRFTIRRDAHLRLWMETEASESATEPQSHHPPGTVRINDDRVTFRTSIGLELEAIGASPTHLNRHFEGIAPGITTQKVKINRLVGKFSSLRGHATPLIGWRMFLRNFPGPTTSQTRVSSPLQ